MQATKVLTEGCPEGLSPGAKVVCGDIENQLNDPRNRSRGGTVRIRATEDRSAFDSAIWAIDEAAEAFKGKGYRVDVRYDDGIDSRYAAQRASTNQETYTLLVLK